jgi:hypothetical protein
MKINVISSKDADNESESRHTGHFGIVDRGRIEGKKRNIKSKFSKMGALSAEDHKVDDD